jgi:AhpD family alkylhydroperoxidase
MDKDYPQLHGRLQNLISKLGEEIPGTMGGFAALHKNAVADGTLTGKTKELIALGIAVAVRCDGCIAYHVHDALKAGATRDEIGETIGVAVLMGGGPALMYGAEAYEALDQFTAAEV